MYSIKILENEHDPYLCQSKLLLFKSDDITVYCKQQHQDQCVSVN